MVGGSFTRSAARVYALGLIALALLVALVSEVPRAARLDANGALRGAIGVSARALQAGVLELSAFACAGFLIWACFRCRERALPPRAGIALLIATLACACVSIGHPLASREYYFDVGDNFHYYTGAKYARELRYDKHYACVATALDAHGRRVPERFRDLKTNLSVRTKHAFRDGARERCRALFSKDRWRAFRRDVRQYRNWQDFGKLEQRFGDHGYNGTPVWSALAGSLANAVPINQHNQTLLALLNPLMLACAFGLVIRAFGWELGLLFSLLFWVNYADRAFLIGAFLRYLPLSLLLAGLALLKRERVLWAGACVGLAAALLVFPGLFLAAATLYFVMQLARDRALTAGSRTTFRFLAAGGVALAAGFTLSLLYTGGVESWQAFLDKMALNSGRLSHGRIGFIFNFLWPREVFTDPKGYAAALEHLRRPLLLGLTLDHVRVALGALLVGALAYSYRRAQLLTFTVLVGFALFFVGFPTVRYYYMGFVALPLALHAAPHSFAARGTMIALCLASAACFALDQHVSHAFVHNTLLTMSFTAVLIALAVPAVARALAPAPAPAGVASATIVTSRS
jgi:hypothetical protein